MTEFAKMDIFFFITSAAVVLLGLLAAIILVYFIKISRDIRYISKKAKSEADFIAQDLSDLRQNLKGKGAGLKHFWSFFNAMSKKRSSRSKQDEEE